MAAGRLVIFLEDRLASVLSDGIAPRLMPQLKSDVVDFNVASECFEAVRKLKRGDLATLRLLVSHQGRAVPSAGGLLLFGRTREREEQFPDAWIQAGRFAGQDKTVIADSAALHGPLVNLVDEAISFVQKHGLHGYDIGAVRRTSRWSLPLVLDAVDRAIVDALQDGEGRSTGEIAKHIERTPRAARVRLLSLVERGMIREIGSSLEDPQRRYYAATLD